MSGTSLVISGEDSMIADVRFMLTLFSNERAIFSYANVKSEGLAYE